MDSNQSNTDYILRKSSPSRESVEEAARLFEHRAESSFPEHLARASTPESERLVDPRLIFTEAPTPQDVSPLEDLMEMFTDSPISSFSEQPMEASFPMDELNARLENRDLAPVPVPSAQNPFSPPPTTSNGSMAPHLHPCGLHLQVQDLLRG